VLKKNLIFLKQKEDFFPFLEDLKAYNNSFININYFLGCNYFKPYGVSYFYDLNIFYIPKLVGASKTSLIFIILIKQINLLLKGMIQGFFVEYKIIGLGFKVKKTEFEQLKILKFDIGYSHYIKFILPENIFFFRIKKRFLLFSNDLMTLNLVSKQIKNLRKLNPYKLRGLKNEKDFFRIKPGKKQNKR
jgi:ribosomal protein L6P/L9E